MSRNTIPSAIREEKEVLFALWSGDLKPITEEQREVLLFQKEAFEKLPESAMVGDVKQAYDVIVRKLQPVPEKETMIQTLGEKAWNVLRAQWEDLQSQKKN